MATFVYSHPEHGSIERQYPCGKAPETVTQEGMTFTRDIAAEHCGYVDHAGNWPLKSDSAGCHPAQRREFMARAEAAGVPTEFDTQGRAVFTSPDHRRRYCESRGYHDNNAGYRDPLPHG